MIDWDLAQSVPPSIHTSLDLKVSNVTPNDAKRQNCGLNIQIEKRINVKFQACGWIYSSDSTTRGNT